LKKRENNKKFSIFIGKNSLLRHNCPRENYPFMENTSHQAAKPQIMLLKFSSTTNKRRGGASVPARELKHNYCLAPSFLRKQESRGMPSRIRDMTSFRRNGDRVPGFNTFIARRRQPTKQSHKLVIETLQMSFRDNLNAEIGQSQIKNKKVQKLQNKELFIYNFHEVYDNIVE
jgi:hypothetical protein